MKINGRLLLILCAVALFVRIWSVNGQQPLRATLPRNAVSTGAGSLAATKKSPYPLMRRSADQRPPSAPLDAFSAGREEFWTVQSVPFKLPEGLAAGTYRVVSDSGRVARLSIEGAAKASGTSVEMMAIATESEQWYLIRLKSEAGTERPSFSTAWQNRMPSFPALPLPLSAPVANRKFDFTGYVPAAAAIDVPPVSEPATETDLPAAPLIQQAERPAPPELPSPL